MALPVWPATVPHAPDAEPWGIQQPFKPPVETEFEEGPIRSRPTADRGFAVYSYTLTMATAAFDAFEAFVRVTLMKGSSRFTMPVRRPSGADLVKTVKIQGGTYSTRMLGASRVQVSFSLQVYG